MSLRNKQALKALEENVRRLRRRADRLEGKSRLARSSRLRRRADELAKRIRALSSTLDEVVEDVTEEHALARIDRQIGSIA